MDYPIEDLDELEAHPEDEVEVYREDGREAMIMEILAHYQISFKEVIPEAS